MTLLAINEWWQARGFGVAVVLCFLASGIITAGLMEVSYDDAYITYRCARNLALGHGLAYNPGESGSATTTPLLAIILAGLEWVTLVDWIPLWGAILSGIALALLGLFILLHARQEQQTGAGWVVLVGLFVNPFLPSVWGGEALLCLALATGAFYFYFRRCPVWAGLFCFPAFLTRGEGLLPLVVMVGHALHRDKKPPWVEIGVVGVLLAAWWFG